MTSPNLVKFYEFAQSCCMIDLAEDQIWTPQISLYEQLFFFLSRC